MSERAEKRLLEEFILVWKQFCDLHQHLYQITCKEYKLLLEGHIDRLGKYLKEKINIINQIKDVEVRRKKYIMCLPSIAGASQLLDYMQSEELREYNTDLIDIIEKIQMQNKKNQMFINKARYNLRKIKDEFSGHHSTPSYDSRGRPQQQSSPWPGGSD